jgi:hypothetical protein
VDPDPIESETFSRIRDPGKNIQDPDPGSSGCGTGNEFEVKLLYKSDKLYKGAKIFVKNIREKKNFCRLRNQLKSRIRIRNRIRNQLKNRIRNRILKNSFRIHNTDGDRGMLLTGLPMVWKGGGTPLARGGRGGGPPIVTIVLVVSKMLKK